MKQIGKLGLGTVQWGLRYGLANQSGMTAPEAVGSILSEARRVGVRILDTAAMYGEAEAVLGRNPLDGFRIITKTPAFALPQIAGRQATELVEAFRQSLHRLSTTRIYGLLVHRADDLLVPGGDKLTAALNALKERGAVEKIGVSVYTADQLDEVMKSFKPDIVQLPLSVLDQRMLLNDRLERMRDARIEIHARSVFLQGLLLMPMNSVPAYFDPIRPLLQRWHASAAEQGLTPTQAALGFVRDMDCVDTVLVGVDDLEQFRSCIADFSTEGSFDASGLACDDARYLNPSLWKL